MEKFKFKIGDFILVILIIGLSIFFFLNKFSKEKKHEKKYLIIESPYEKLRYKIIPQNKKIKIKGRLGYSTILVTSNYVKMIDSPCPNKLCIKQGKIFKSGESIICVPNQIIVKIVSEKSLSMQTQEVDVICR